jgi:predicted MFS family arabinose efflux permease
LSDGGVGGRGRALLPAFGLGAITVSFMQALVVPAVGDIAATLDVSDATAGWAVTSNLLACAVLTPLLGRLGDLRGRRMVVLWAIGACLLGSVLAAVTSSLPLLLLARVLQGASGGVFPLAVGILRAELPPGRVVQATAVVSGMLSFGAGLGLVLTGVLTGGGADYHRIFWVAALVSALALGALAWAVPRRVAGSARADDPAREGLDLFGAALLGGGLLGLLLALSQATRWSALPLVASALAGVAFLLAWAAWERRAPSPLVDPATMGRRPVLVTNAAGLFVGLANFGCVLSVTRLAQDAFDASVLTTALVYLLPGTLCSAVAAPLGGELVARAGGRAVMLLAGAMGALGYVALAAGHGAPAVVVGAAIAVMCSISLAYAAMPALLAAEVPGAQTAVANSINSVARWVGGAAGSALVVSLLSGSAPSDGAFVAVFAIGATGCALSTLLVARGLSAARPPAARTAAARP